MYLNGRLPKAENYLEFKSLIPAAVDTREKSQHLVLHLFLLLFTCGPCIQPAEPIAIPVALGNPVTESAL